MKGARDSGLSLLCLCLLMQQATASIILEGPAEPVKPGQYVQIYVRGLAEADLPKARATCTPMEGVFFLSAQTWGGQPFLLFSAQQPGKYTIAVTLNGWRYSWQAAVVEAEAARIDAEDLVAIRQLNTQLANKYAYEIGQLLVDVQGEGPDPDPDPDPVPVENLYVFFVYETADIDEQPWLANLITSQKIRRLASNKVRIVFVDKDEKDEEGNTPAFTRKWIEYVAKQGLSLPRLFFVDQEGALVHHQEPPKTVGEAVTLIERYRP